MGQHLIAVLAMLLAGCGRPAAPDAPLRAVEHGDAERGRLLMGHYQCGSCHAVPGVPAAVAASAPPLQGFGRRSYIAGRLPNGPANLQRWLQDPSATVPGATMPRLGVAPQDARDIAAYLMSLE